MKCDYGHQRDQERPDHDRRCQQQTSPVEPPAPAVVAEAAAASAAQTPIWSVSFIALAITRKLGRLYALFYAATVAIPDNESASATVLIFECWIWATMSAAAPAASCDCSHSAEQSIWWACTHSATTASVTRGRRRSELPNGGTVRRRVTLPTWCPSGSCPVTARGC